ncbi:MAG: hypothetical protein LBC83_02105 [Oscillospiraceae bacterium]|jgi:shikimate dehydrogenase|nr:hypothetical protein [Oscillospiraceae bacterium]
MQYGLIGEHLGHSYSPEIHKLLRGYDYALWPMPPADLPDFFARREFLGVNVTIPYKKAAMSYCDALGDTARRVGCVNTIVRRADGTLFGDNTDVSGFSYMLREADISLAGKHVLILGGGGASLTARLVAADAGAASCRTVSREGELNYGNVTVRCPQTQVIVNATPVGMFPNSGASLVEPAKFAQLEAGVDLIYNPLRSRFLQLCVAKGCKTADGLSMLVAQAEAAAAIFTGEHAAPGAVERVLGVLRRKIENWVLVGMPGSGKSTAGAYLAAQSGRTFYDTDAVIAGRAGMSIPEYFATRGEAAFRELESAVVSEIGAKTGVVIATGGGAILRAENVAALRQNGRLLWIRRAAEVLAQTGRPLSKDLASLRVMEQARRPYYETAANAVVENDSDRDALQARVLEYFRD